MKYLMSWKCHYQVFVQDAENLQLGLIEDSEIRKETQFGKTAIIWQKKDQQ